MSIELNFCFSCFADFCLVKQKNFLLYVKISFLCYNYEPLKIFIINNHEAPLPFSFFSEHQGRWGKRVENWNHAKTEMNPLVKQKKVSILLFSDFVKISIRTGIVWTMMEAIEVWIYSRKNILKNYSDIVN